MLPMGQDRDRLEAGAASVLERQFPLFKTLIELKYDAVSTVVKRAKLEECDWQEVDRSKGRRALDLTERAADVK